MLFLQDRTKSPAPPIEALFWESWSLNTEPPDAKAHCATEFHLSPCFSMKLFQMIVNLNLHAVLRTNHNILQNSSTIARLQY